MKCQKKTLKELHYYLRYSDAKNSDKCFDKDKVKHVFFIAETKGTMEDMQLNKIESNKIECAKKLFNVVSTCGVKYDHVDSFEQLKNVIGLKG